MHLRLSSALLPLCALIAAAPSGAQRPGRDWLAAPPTDVFEVFERSILDLQAAQADGRVTSQGLVDAYVARIAAYDHAGPRINAIVTLNPRAREDAAALDAERRARGARGPLHGIPVLVKDNYDTTDMPTSAGTLALATLQPQADAFQVKRLRDAGAVILGKTTMHELAAGITTVSSLSGRTRNPYDPERVPGGSSGGSGAAIGASFAAAALGSDTCGSIRIPAAYQNLVGLRATSGLSSRSGVIPLSSTQDIAGPLARTVTDLALMLDATVGPDPADATTRDAARHVPPSYQAALVANGQRGARIGVLRSLFGNTPDDEEAAEVVRKALDAMKAQGAEIVDIVVPGLDDLLRDSSVILDEFKFDFAEYLSRHPGAPVRSLGDIVERGLHHESLDAAFRRFNAPERRATERYRQALVRQRALRAGVSAVFESERLDAIAYPTMRRPAPLIRDRQSPGVAGRANNCQVSANSGLPAISIPAGFTVDGLPIGMDLLGAAFTETTLLTLAYGWEQSARPRRPPFSTPPLVNGAAPPPIQRQAVVSRSSASARVTFTYDRVTGVLDYDASVSNLGGDAVVALTLQRGEALTPGPVLAHLLLPNQTATHDSLILAGRDREDVAAGKVYVHLYTRRFPLGAGRTALSPF